MFIAHEHEIKEQENMHGLYADIVKIKPTNLRRLTDLKYTNLRRLIDLQYIKNVDSNLISGPGEEPRHVNI